VPWHKSPLAGPERNKVSAVTETAQSKRRSLKPLARLFPYVMRYRKLVAGALFFLGLAAATTLALPLAVRRMVDHGFSAADSAFINNYFGMMAILAIILALASAMRYYFVITIGERVVSDLRRDVFAHVTRLSPAFFDVNQSGEIVSRLTADTTQIKSAVGATASLALRNSILCLGAMAMMIYTSPRLSILVLAAIPIIVFPLVAFGRSVRRRSRLAQDTLAEASAFAGETIGAARTVQAFNAEGIATDRYGTTVEQAYEAARAAIKSRALLTGVAITLVFGSIVAVLWFGAQSVLAGTLSAGTLGQFLLYSLIAAGSMGTLSEVWGELSQASGAAERLGELLQEVSQVAVPANPIHLPSPPLGRVSFGDVHFAYPSSASKSALKGLSFRVEPGETVAIVGPSGAGKSTVFSLILRFYDPVSGTVRIDDVDIREAHPEEVRSRIAIVPQDVTIFASSIRDNIAFGSPDATPQMVEAAAEAAQATEFILRLENGFDTQVGERGITLSGGQRQRIAIARALLRDAPLLLLDEATSSLDAESETLVQKALDGRIVEEGTHHSLIQQGGLYAKLARLQFETGGRDFTSPAIE